MDKMMDNKDDKQMMMDTMMNKMMNDKDMMQMMKDKMNSMSK